MRDIGIYIVLFTCATAASAHADRPVWRAGARRHAVHHAASASGDGPLGDVASMSLDRGDLVDVAQLDAVEVHAIDARLAEEVPSFGPSGRPLVIDVSWKPSGELGVLRPGPRIGAPPEVQHRDAQVSTPRELDVHPLMDDARVALGAGKDGLAKARANALIALAPQLPEADAADAVHRARIVLGELALRAGDIDDAVAQLELAANVEGSPLLDSVGPDFALAQKLLERGRTAEVLRYLDRVGVFWDEAACLASWKTTLAGGELPDLMRAWDCTAKKKR